MMYEFHLKTLYGSKKQCPQFLIKEIKIDGIVEMTVRLKYMGGLSCYIGRR